MILSDNEPVTLFLSYAREDESLCRELEKHLKPLKQQGLISMWHEWLIEPGVVRTEKIDEQFNNASIILLLVSSDFIDSDYYCSVEMQQALARHDARNAYVIPIILRSVDLQETPLKTLQALPRGGKAITLWPNRDEVFKNVAQEISYLVRGVRHISPFPEFRESRNPYKGLEAFGKKDVGDFFGRETLIGDCLNMLEKTLQMDKQGSQHERLLAVFGQSGVGKSSLVMAGIVPQLQAGGIFNSKEWVYLEPIVPGNDPLEALLKTLKPHFPDTSFETLRKDMEDPSALGLQRYVSWIAQQQDASDMRVLLVVDQFEELFTQITEEETRLHFFRLLMNAITAPGGPLVVILTVRADFYGHVMQYSDFYRLISAHFCPVRSMEIADMRQVIEQPALLPDVRLRFEDGLVNDLLLDAQAGMLPLLQFTLDQLFQRRDGDLLTRAAYEKIGRVKGALLQRAEETYKGLSEEQREMAKIIFLRLIIPGTTEQEIARRRARFEELEVSDLQKRHLLLTTANRFVAERLLTTNEVAGEATIEVSHEALLQVWPLLKGWVQEAREGMLIQQTLSENVVEWEQHKKSPERLYRGKQLKEAREWARRVEPSTKEAAFLQASTVYRRVWFGSLAFVVVLLFTLMGTAGWSFASYQAIHPDPTLVTTLQDNVLGSLRYCIENAPSRSIIRFASNLHGTIHLKESLSFVSGEQLTIQGLGADKITISGSNANIQVPKDAKVDIVGLSFKNSETSINAFLFNEGTLKLTNSIISNNKTTGSASSYGGGIENKGNGVLEVIHSTISNNLSINDLLSDGGGGIYNEGSLKMSDTTVSNNSTHSSNLGAGGGIYNTSTGIATVTSSTFFGNIASDDMNKTSFKGGAGGGGIENEGKLIVTNSTFSNNKAASNSGIGYGGGIDNNGNNATVTVSNSTFLGNSATGNSKSQGGGIDNQGLLTITSSTFSENRVSSNAIGLGGGIVNQSSATVIVNNSTFLSNSVTGKLGGQGGGIDNDGKFTITSSIFSGNMTDSSATGFGGGIDSTGTLMVSNSIFSSNSATGKANGEGGGIYNEGLLTITRNTFSNNVARADSAIGTGGGIFNDKTGILTVNTSTFSGNSATGKKYGQGGGIENVGKLTSTSSTFSNNIAHSNNTTSFGGGIDSNGSLTSIRFTIFAANSADNGPDVFGPVISGGYNLLTDVANIVGLDGTTDRQVSLADLKLDPTLSDNGGPTQTLKLLPGSPAIDAIPQQVCSFPITDASGHAMIITTDQRGNSRPDGGENACDIGAYESSY